MIAFENANQPALFLLAVVAFSNALVADETQDDSVAFDAVQTRFFESKVRPLLIDHCVRCHGEEKQEGGLRLDSQSAFSKGGESGAIIDSATPPESTILSAIHYTDLEMPPSGKLSDERIEIIERWVLDGSYWPPQTAAMSTIKSGQKVFSDEDRSYWFFQSLAPIASIDQRQNESVSYRLDSLIQAGHTANNLSFAEPAE